MNPVPRVLFAALVIAVCSACSVVGLAGERAIPQTRGFQSDSHFHFTISPDDHWLVYFEQLTPEQIGTRDNQFGNLRVLDLRSGELHALTLAEGQAPERLRHGDASWAPDSSHCLLPPPIAVPADAERGILIDLHDPANIRVVPTRVQHRPSAGVEVQGEQYQLLDRYSCSDCSPHLHDVELMKKHVDAKYLGRDLGGSSVNPNPYAEQIVSHDGTKIYFQKKDAKAEEVSLFELDISSGVERELASYRGSDARIDYMRPSPDGKKLAFQLKTGDFGIRCTVYVLELATRNYQKVAEDVAYTMHWTSDSQRLYFLGSNHLLHVAEFDRPAQPPSTKPEQN